MPRPPAILAALGPDADGPTDADLLRRFAEDRDAGAFELLVWRHAGLVLRTCRGLLRDHHAAEDAAQAVFLALARQAASVGRTGAAAGWLFRVARRVAARAAKRQPRPAFADIALDTLPAPATPAPDPDLALVLDQEFARLPERYRAPVLLCLVEGLTHAQAARRLGWPVGSVAGRLARAKGLLAARLTRRGVALSLLTRAAVAVPATFAAATTRAAIGFVTRGRGVLPAAVLDQARRELRMVIARKVFGFGVVAAVACVGLAGLRGSAEPPAPAPAPRPKPAATGSAGVVPPRAVVLAASEDARTGLASGIGEGMFEMSGSDGKPVKFALRVSHAGPKFWAQLTHMEGGRENEWPTTLVVVYDGETVAYREENPRFRPTGEEARVFAAKPDEFGRYPASVFAFNPPRLQAAVLDLPAYLKNRPETAFAFTGEGVSATAELSNEPPVSTTITFPKRAGYNVGSYAVHRADTGYTHTATATWGRSNGVWYVKEVEKADAWCDRPRTFRKLTYTSFAANAKVDPALFRLPALGLTDARSRLIFMDFRTGGIDLYTHDPSAPVKETDALLDGLRRLPLRASIRPPAKES